MEELRAIPWWAIVLIGMSLISQSMFLFFHSRRYGHQKWFWGIWGVFSVPMPLIVYWLWIKWLKPKLQN